MEKTEDTVSGGEVKDCPIIGYIKTIYDDLRWAEARPKAWCDIMNSMFDREGA